MVVQAQPAAQNANASSGPSKAVVTPAASALRSASQPNKALAIALMRDLAANRKLYRTDMRPMYHRLQYRGLWIDPATGQLNEAGEEALASLANAAKWGLLTNYRKPLGNIPAKLQYTPPQLARLELKITNALLRMLADLANGQLDQSNPALGWGIQPVRVSFRRLMNMLTEGQSLAKITENISEQRFGQAGLLEQLAKYEQIVTEGGWPLVLADKVLRPGMVDSAIVTLRRRLTIEGYLAEEKKPGKGAVKVTAKTPQLYDRKLAEVVARFQATHGLKADGEIGPATQLALNLPARLRRDQVLANLERLRWLPQELGEQRVWVNIPAFRLQLVVDEKAQLDMGVIVGTKKRQTPVFDDLISQVEVNPTWNVPNTVAFEDYLPELRKNPLYLQKKNIRVFKGWQRGADELDPSTVDWQAVNDKNRRWFPYRLTQDPGPKNALGRVKFLFPNSHSVYLHDTPDRRLFSRTSRSLSSGCVRVEDPAALAEYFLTERLGSPRNYSALLKVKKTKRLFLDGSVPVYLAYFTAWVDEFGQMQFRDDIYQHDRPLLKLLEDMRPVSALPPLKKKAPAVKRPPVQRVKPRPAPVLQQANAKPAVKKVSPPVVVAKVVQPAKTPVAASSVVARPVLKTTDRPLPKIAEGSATKTAALVSGGGVSNKPKSLDEILAKETPENGPVKELAKPRLKTTSKIAATVKPNTAAPVLVQARNKPVLALDAKAVALPPPKLVSPKAVAVGPVVPASSPVALKQAGSGVAPVLVEARTKPVMALDVKATALPQVKAARVKPKAAAVASAPVTAKLPPSNAVPAVKKTEVAAAKPAQPTVATLKVKAPVVKPKVVEVVIPASSEKVAKKVAEAPEKVADKVVEEVVPVPVSVESMRPRWRAGGRRSR